MSKMLFLLVMSLGALLPPPTGARERLNVAVAGEGPTVVLLPGLSGCAYGYRKVVPLLNEAGYRTLVVEPLGIGDSGRPDGADYSLTAQADRVATVIEENRAGPTIVVGHGVAASVAMRLAYRRPDLVAAVVSIEGGPDEATATPGMKRALKLGQVVARLGGKNLIRDKLREGMIAASGDGSWVSGVVVRKYFAPIGRDPEAALKAFRAMAESVEPESLRANLGRIACRVVLLTGGAEHQGAVSASDIDLMSLELASLETVTVPGAGHFIFEENPDAVVGAVRIAAGPACGGGAPDDPAAVVAATARK